MEYSLIYGYSVFVGTGPLNKSATESDPNFPLCPSIEKIRICAITSRMFMCAPLVRQGSETYLWDSWHESPPSHRPERPLLPIMVWRNGNCSMPRSLNPSAPQRYASAPTAVVPSLALCTTAKCAGMYDALAQ